MSRLWGGRFSGGLDPRFEGFNRSLGIDSRMWREDIQGSLAWVKALHACKVLSGAEERTIREGLERLALRLAEKHLLVKHQFQLPKKRGNEPCPKHLPYQ